jgi:hypothetical protein
MSQALAFYALLPLRRYTIEQALLMTSHTFIVRVWGSNVLQILYIKDFRRWYLVKEVILLEMCP